MSPTIDKTIDALASRAVSPRSGVTHTGSQRLDHAYTLIELMVVIAIIVISLAIIIPGLNKFMELTMDNTAKNGLNTATTAIRAYATRDVTFAKYGSYNGVAIIVTPSSELRMTEHYQYALDTSSPAQFLEDATGFNGFIDIYDREYITTPKDTGFVGILAPSGTKQYVAPPFAIWFNKDGQLTVTDTGDDQTCIFYDGNYDGRINIVDNIVGYDRETPFDGSGVYKLGEWDPWSPDYAPGPNNNPGIYKPSNEEDENYGKYKLPFEKLEAVIGVVLYSKRQYREDGGSWVNGYTPSTPSSGCGTDHSSSCGSFNEWLQEHGEVIFFSRYTGAILKHK